LIHHHLRRQHPARIQLKNHAIRGNLPLSTGEIKYIREKKKGQGGNGQNFCGTDDFFKIPKLQICRNLLYNIDLSSRFIREDRGLEQA
jgi:hypothetical protein